MTLTMKQVAEQFSLSEHTLRYYDNIDLIPGVIRNAQGRREFTEEAVGWLQFIVALRTTGMSLDEIRHYIELTYAGSDTIETRINMLQHQSAHVDQQIQQLQEQRAIITDKIKHYQESLATGTTLSPNKKPYQGQWV
ncbi:MAG: MerR family transcriptional regulator [Lactobacillus sp.]|jgi:DNA-binding transcriptional MerR regulator|nr:MerR family transcriptional regulator [Lactobacillus sp.]MCI2031946.1 MerR family transcriptional regulator [Lactobacillus sp.]